MGELLEIGHRADGFPIFGVDGTAAVASNVGEDLVVEDVTEVDGSNYGDVGGQLPYEIEEIGEDNSHESPVSRAPNEPILVSRFRALLCKTPEPTDSKIAPKFLHKKKRSYSETLEESDEVATDASTVSTPTAKRQRTPMRLEFRHSNQPHRQSEDSMDVDFAANPVSASLDWSVGHL